MSTGLCECGCGRATTVRYGRVCRFISGHNKGRKGTGAGYTAACIRCGVIVPVRPHYAGNRKFCSNACRDTYRSEHAGAEHPSYRRVALACEICGVTFTATPSRAQKRTYCQPACANVARSRRLLALGADSESEKSRKARALERDRGACRICGFAEVVDVHHIVAKAKGGTHALDNLITLCPNHHALAHRGELGPNELRTALPT